MRVKVGTHTHIVNLRMHMHKYSPEMYKYLEIGPNMVNTWPQRAGGPWTRRVWMRMLEELPLKYNIVHAYTILMLVCACSYI